MQVYFLECISHQFLAILIPTSEVLITLTSHLVSIILQFLKEINFAYQHVPT
jgi:hypothetical protein